MSYWPIVTQQLSVHNLMRGEIMGWTYGDWWTVHLLVHQSYNHKFTSRHSKICRIHWTFLFISLLFIMNPALATCKKIDVVTYDPPPVHSFVVDQLQPRTSTDREITRSHSLASERSVAHDSSSIPAFHGWCWNEESCNSRASTP